MTNDINKIFSNLKIEQKLSKIDNTKSKTIDEITEKWGLNQRMVDLFESKIDSETKLKNKYAIILLSALIGQIIILNIWFCLKGIGVLEFSDMTFNIFITGGIAEIYVLIRVIVKHLFKDNLSEILNVIITSNNTPKKGNNTNKYKNIPK